MRRRTFLAMVSGGFLAAPLTAEAQPPERPYRIAHLYAGPRSGNQAVLASFQQGMRELGYIEGVTWSSSPDSPTESSNVSRRWPESWCRSIRT